MTTMAYGAFLCAMSFERQRETEREKREWFHENTTAKNAVIATDGDDQSALHANECHCVINVY